MELFNQGVLLNDLVLIVIILKYLQVTKSHTVFRLFTEIFKEPQIILQIISVKQKRLFLLLRVCNL